MRNKFTLLTLCLTILVLLMGFTAFSQEPDPGDSGMIGDKTGSVKDTIAPVFTNCPAEVIDLGCNPPVVNERQAVSDAGIVTDNSGGNLKINAIPGEVSGTCQKSQTWIVTATDGSGNSATCRVSYMWIVDTEPPVVSLILPEIWVECRETPDIPLPEVTDNCDDDPEFEYIDQIIQGVCNDDKGNLPASGNALKREFHVEGTGIPANFLNQFQLNFEVNQGKGRAEFTLVSPYGEAIILVGPYCEGGECDWPDPSHKPVYSPVFSSAQDNPVWNNADFIQEGDGNFRPFGGNADATPNEGYLAEEVPGFNGTYVSSFEELKGSMDGTWTLYCRKNDDINGEVQFNGACMIPKCPEEYTIKRLWTVSDNCGNSAQAVQTIHVTDNTPPEISLPAGELTLSCYDQALADAWIATAFATDACTGATSVTASFTPPPDNCNQTVIVTFTATDKCRNTAVVTKSFSVNDLIPPVLSGVPEDITIQCDENPPVLPPGLVTASDNCDDVVAVTFSETRVDGECPGNYAILRTWMASDHCGNEVQATQTVQVVDTKAPVLSGIPVDLTLECDQIPAVLPPGSVTAVDNCDADVPVVYEQTRVDGECPDNYTLLRTWTATDDCGNMVSATQVITMADTTPPVLSEIPAGVTAECNALPETATVTATDNCDADVPVIYEQTRIDGDCPNSYTLLRTWTATDDCGNQVSALQTITVVDTTAPVLSGVPEDFTIECDAIPSVLPPGTVTATDNCDPVLDVTFNETSTVINGCGILLRTWHVTDDCGNSASATQQITVTDTKPPVIVCPPDTVLTIPAGSQSVIWNYLNPSVTDNCTPTESITISGVRSDGKPLEDPWTEGVTTITWTSADWCQNQAGCVQKVTVKSGCLTVEAWVYLEGAAVDPGGAAAFTVPMRTDLNDLRILPGQTYDDIIFGSHYTDAGQPYNTDPWNYRGNEGAYFDSEGDPARGKAGYPLTVTDWVLVSLRTGIDTTGGPACQAAALLHNDGRIEFVEDFECCDLDLTVPYYVVIEHHNHLIIMSQEPVMPVNGVITYDFRTTQSYIDPLWGPAFYVGQKEINPGVFAMYAGNGDQEIDDNSDTDLNFNDRNSWETDNRNFARYLTGDFNLNGDTNFNDRILWEFNNSKFTSVPR